jgi:hypothetical protein
MSSDTLSQHHIPTDSLIVELDELRRTLINAGQPRAAIRRLHDTIAYLRHLSAVPDALGSAVAP